MQHAVKDLYTGLLRWRLWLMLAQDDWRIRYYRTILGPIWIIVSFLAFVAVKLIIFTELSDADARYFGAYLTVGFMIWAFLAQSITEGTATFVRSRNWVLGVAAPYSIFLYANLCNALFNVIFTGLTAIIIAYLVYPFSLLNIPLAIIGFLFIAFSLFWVQLGLAVIGVFSRDALQFVSTIMRVLFFLSPILWVPESLGEIGKYVAYNPFTYYLNLVRQLLLQGSTDLINWVVIGGITLTAMIGSTALFGFARTRIPSYV